MNSSSNNHTVNNPASHDDILVDLDCLLMPQLLDGEDEGPGREPACAGRQRCSLLQNEQSMNSSSNNHTVNNPASHDDILVDLDCLLMPQLLDGEDEGPGREPACAGRQRCSLLQNEQSMNSSSNNHTVNNPASHDDILVDLDCLLMPQLLDGEDEGSWLPPSQSFQARSCIPPPRSLACFLAKQRAHF
ncbi:hypothetical protein DIPPA_17484 [Diplonema papillatum]|nr:hypothetical protein DIPPA_17484 [Diplonema papillatum]